MFAVALKTLGCKLNQHDSEFLRRRLRELGAADWVPWGDPADVYILNTCTVTAAADRTSRKLIRKATATNPDALILVTGCYAQVAPGELAGLDGVDWVVGTAEKDRIPELVRSWLDEREGGALLSGDAARVLVGDLRKADQVGAWDVRSYGHRTRAFMKIQ
jgi:threonylcarbamoyladenosine tRNA methylthiotransferase MtaB